MTSLCVQNRQVFGLCRLNEQRFFTFRTLFIRVLLIKDFGLFRIHFRQVSLYIVIVDDVFREKSTFMVDNGVCLIFTDKKWGEHLVA